MPKISTRVTRRIIREVAHGHLCTIDELPNGAAHIRGPAAELQLVWQALWERCRFSPRFVKSSTIDGAPQDGFPRIEIHPQVWQRR